MKVGVTGGTGFIGKRVVRVLRERGHEVVCLVRSPERAQALTALGATLARGDILDRQSLEAAFKGCEGVIHLAASYEVGLRFGSERAERSLQQNVEGTRNALEVAVAAGCKRIVYTSSIVIHGSTEGRVVTEDTRPPAPAFPWPHVSVYFLGKARAHHEVAGPMMAAGAPLVAVLPGAVIGPGDTSTFNLIFEFIAAGLPGVVGGSRWTLVGVEDCALGHVLALERGKPGNCYHLTNENVSLEELYRRAAGLVGKSGPVVRLPDWMLRAQIALSTLLERAFTVPRLVSSETARGMLSAVTLMFDSTRTQQELGWTPASTDVAIKEALAYELAKRGKPLPRLLEGVNPRT